MKCRKQFTAGSALAIVTLAACGTTTSTVTVSPSAPESSGTSPAATPATASPSASAAVPVISPGQIVTFKVDSGDTNDDITSVTWTMGRKVTQATTDTLGPVQKGYEDVVFDVTIRDDGPYVIQGDPTYQASLVWDGVDGRTDNKLAMTATGVSDGEFPGQRGTQLGLESGLRPGQYVTGYLAWLVPNTENGWVELDSRQSAVGGSTTPDVIINYDSLSASQLQS